MYIPYQDALFGYETCAGFYFMCLRCDELDEPPWWPNNRDRCYMSMQRRGLFTDLPHAVRRDIACYIAVNSK